MPTGSPSKVIYTVLLGRYEELNELLHPDAGVRAICFTDDPELTSTT